MVTPAGSAAHPGKKKRSVVVHHRVPGKSALPLMLALCPGCHARVHHIKVVMSELPPLLLQLWREQHPNGHEQRALNFRLNDSQPVPVPLFD